jgi:putative NADPH-quinone reductase
MRVLVLHAHPNPESFNAALYARTLDGLRAAGHEVDACDLYAEDFQPVLTRAERLGYHAVPENRAPVEPYLQRLERAEALVLVYPVWNFGMPAMLKGFFDRVFLPGVSFKLVDGKVRPSLYNIRKLVVVTTYGGARWRALTMGDPPRRIAKRVLRAVIHPTASTAYLAHYDMNRSTDATRAAFLEKVGATMATF